MKTILSKNLLPGMVLAEDVATPNSNRLFEKGTILSSKDIAKIAFYSIREVMVEEDDVDRLLMSNESVSGLTSSEMIRRSQVFREFKKDFEECASKFEEDIKEFVINGKSIDINKLVEPIYALLNRGTTTVGVFQMLHNLRNYDDATYTHCINVALATNILAQWMKWSPEEIETATFAGLFHDIGKILVPDSIITKPAKLDAEELAIVRTHPQKGYDILKDMDISTHVKNAALMHHERCDGSGYPTGMKAPMIDKYAKIVSIVDVYDAMTSARHYREPLCPFIAISMFEEEGYHKYDTEMILCFLENVVNTYLLDTVKLNTGEVGEIVFINRTFLSKPTIKIGEDYIDLSKCNGVYIQEVL